MTAEPLKVSRLTDVNLAGMRSSSIKKKNMV